ncbi:LPS translocon maturation chaperone LptM [Pseudaquabacterium inlustre]|uniref:LPS translocon maturation chaperone LptM n=1 Tax=Pseudaquabacterium inlustre TaxID=2984192 RepID=UPI003BF9CF76
MTSSSSQRSVVASMRASTAPVRRWNSASDSGVAAGAAVLMVGKIPQMTLRSSVARAPAPCRPSGKRLQRLGCRTGLLAAVALLGACGQKGPLTLPAGAAPAATTASAPGAAR